MARVRVPAHITEQVSRDFGLNVKVSPLIRNKVEEYPSGNPAMEGMAAPGQPSGNYPYRKVIPAGVIGSEEQHDPSRPGQQYVDTVQSYETEQNDPTLHGPLEAMRSANRGVPFNDYASFQPRSAAIPRARQDESILGNLAYMSADPLMTDESSDQLFLKRDDPRRKDLYGENRAGFLHNDDEQNVSEAERAQLSQRRGQAAAQMPAGPEKKEFIARQGETEASDKSRVAYRRMSNESALRGY